MTRLTDLSLGEITQSLLALIVVVGGGSLIAFAPETRELVAGLIGLVLGFYFNRANGFNRKGTDNGSATAGNGTGAGVSGADG